MPLDALGGDEGDERRGGLLDHRIAGDLEAAQEHGFAGAWRAGENVAVHEDL
jgi:hypothetical protein